MEAPEVTLESIYAGLHDLLNIRKEDVLCCYQVTEFILSSQKQFGSRVYGTHSIESDYDFKVLNGIYKNCFQLIETYFLKKFQNDLYSSLTF